MKSLTIAAIAVSVMLFVLSLCGWLRRHDVYFFREAVKKLPRSAVERLLLLVMVCGLIHYGGSKETNGTDRAVGDAPVLRDAGDVGEGAVTNAPLRFTSIDVGSNSLSLALAWSTNFSPARAWLELHWASKAALFSDRHRKSEVQLSRLC